MKNWPSSALPWQIRTSITVSNKILQFVAKRKKREKGVLSQLQVMADYGAEWTQRQNADITPADGVYPTLRRIIFYDIYSIEDFDQLDIGLQKIQDAFQPPKGSFARVIERRKEHSSWLDKARSSTFSAGMTTLGALYFDGSAEVDYFKYARLWLTGISPSFVCLSIIAEPSEKLKTAYASAIEGPTPIDQRITFPNLGLRSGSWRNWYRFGESWGSAIKARHRILDELFLEANQQLVRVLRKDVNSGLSTRGPLPFIEILTIEKPLSDIPTSRGKSTDDIDIGDLEFFGSIGSEVAFTNPYVFKWLRFTKIKRSEHYNLHAHQMLISLADFRGAGDYKDEEETLSKLAMRLYYLAPQLCSTLSIRALFYRLQQDIIESRNALVPSLNYNRRSSPKIRGLKRSINRLSYLNSLQFQQERIWAELNSKNQISFLTRGLKGARRYPYKKGRRVDFLDDWLRDIETLKESNEQLMDVLRPAYQEMLSLKNILATYWLQMAVFALTFILLILTTLMVPSKAWETTLAFFRDFLSLF